MEIAQTEIRMYSIICSHDGIKARDIAGKIGVDKTQINRLLYSAPFIRELCYVDDEFCWHGMIRQSRPHIGLGDFCGYYATVDRFLDQPEEAWLDELKKGCGDFVRVVLTDRMDLDVIDMQDRLHHAFPYLLEIRREVLRGADYSTEYTEEAALDPFELCCAFLKDLDEGEQELLRDVINRVQEVQG